MSNARRITYTYVGYQNFYIILPTLLQIKIHVRRKMKKFRDLFYILQIF